MGVHISNIALSSNNLVYISSPLPSVGGSALFTDGNNSNLVLSGSSDWAPGTSDFTIEWWQYATEGSSTAQRIFSIGGYPSASIAVSQESQSTFYFWAAGSYQISFSIDNLNEWHHYAIVRYSGTTTVYQDGNEVGSTSSEFDISDSSTPLSIGAEYQTESAGVTYYSGNLTNFRWVDGVAVYTSNFTVPTSPLSVISGTKLLMKELNSANLLTDSAQGLSVTNNDGVTWSNMTPF